MKKLLVMMMFLMALAMSCNLAHAAIVENSSNSIRIITIGGTRYSMKSYDVTSDSSGNASLAITKLEGAIDHVVVRLDTTDTPSTGWSIYLYNRNATIKYDMLYGYGVSRLNTADVIIRPIVDGLPYVIPYSGSPYLVMSGMGSTKKAVVEIWVVDKN